MSEPALDDLFRTFQRTGDPRAIAAVYDAIAPRLLALASHLGHRHGDAEDLVQATFVAVIERPEQYDGVRPLMPWLVGILANQARAAHRARVRRPDPDRVPAIAIDADPANAAETAELLERLDRVLTALPANYRETLVLRWVHGFAPIEIAHTLGVSPDTVKTRLRRGQDLLRQALPAGFASAGALAMLTPASGLAAIRERIVQVASEQDRWVRASNGEPNTPGSGCAALRRVPWSAAIVITTIVTIAGMFVTFDSESPQPESKVGHSPRPATSIQSQHDADPVRVAVAPSLAETTNANATATVRFSDGGPAAGVWVGAVPLDDPEPFFGEVWVRSDALGRADFGVLPSGRREFVTARGGSTIGTGSGATVLVIPRGIDVQGVVRRAGSPVADAMVWVTREDTALEGHEATRTDTNGAFTLRSLAPGRAVTIVEAGVALAPLRQVLGVPGDTTRLVFELAAATAQEIESEIVDEFGVPVADAVMQIGRARRTPMHRELLSETGLVPPITLRTASDGRLRFSSAAAEADDLVRCWVRARGHAAAYVCVPSTEHRLRIVLPRADLELVGRAIDAMGAPIERVRVTVGDGKPIDPDAPRWFAPTAWTDADGGYSIARAAHATHAFATRADGRSVTGQLDRSGRWDPIFATTAALCGRVVDAGGGGLAGLRVEARRDGGNGLAAVAITGVDGAFEFADPADDPHTIRVTDPQSSWSGALAVRTAVRAGAPVHVVIPDRRLPRIEVCGRITGASGAAVEASVQVVSSEDGSGYVRSDPNTGAFRLARMPALGLGYTIRVQSLDGRHACVVGPLDAPAGATSLDFGMLRLSPTGRLIGRVRHGVNRTPALASATIETAGGTIVVAGMPIENGVVRSPQLPIGDYVIHFLGPGSEQHASRFSIRPDATTEAEWTLSDGVCCELVHVHPRDVEDVVAVRLAWLDERGEIKCHDDYSWHPSRELRLSQRLAPGWHSLLAIASTGRVARAQFEVRDGAPPPSVTLKFE